MRAGIQKCIYITGQTFKKMNCNSRLKLFLALHYNYFLIIQFIWIMDKGQHLITFPTPALTYLWATPGPQTGTWVPLTAG